METLPPIISKLLHYALSALGGFLIALETSVAFIIPCFIITALDVFSAYCLGRRLHRKYPHKCDGKFKSEYKFRILRTMILALTVIILAKYTDMLILGEGNLAVRWAAGFFFLYQAWSILENWSSENNNPWAKIIQRIVVNKAERHFGIEIKNILLPEEKKEENDNTDTQGIPKQ
jgi:hypothetical protein